MGTLNDKAFKKSGTPAWASASQAQLAKSNPGGTWAKTSSDKKTAENYTYKPAAPAASTSSAQPTQAKAPAALPKKGAPAGSQEKTAPPSLIGAPKSSGKTLLGE